MSPSISPRIRAGIGVEADLEPVGAVIGRQLLGRDAVFRASHRQCHLVAVDADLHRAGLLAGDGRDAVDAGRKALRIELQQLVVRRRDHPVIIGEGAVDQLVVRIALPSPKRILVGDNEISTVPSSSSRSRQTSATALLGMMTSGIPSAPSGFGPYPREAVAVGCCGAELIVGDVEEDAHQIIAGLFARDGEAGPLDDLAQNRGGNAQLATLRLHVATPPAVQPAHQGHGPLHGIGTAAYWTAIGGVYALAFGIPLLAVALLIWLVVRTLRRRRVDALLSRP